MKLAGLRINTGVAIGAGVVMLAPIALPMLAGVLRPVAKAGIKAGLLTYHKVKEVTAEAVESIEDLAAEAKAEVAEPAKAKPKKARAKKA